MWHACDYSYSQQGQCIPLVHEEKMHQMNGHIASVHGGKKKKLFECTICDTRFAQKTHFNKQNASVIIHMPSTTFLVYDME